MIMNEDLQEFLVRLIWPVLAVMAYLASVVVSSNISEQDIGAVIQLDLVLLSAIFGFVVTIWFSQKNVLRLKKVIESSSEVQLEIIRTDPERLSVVSQLYETTGATIISTHLSYNYSPPFGEKDVAYRLYRNARNRFIRIVSANTPAHKKWIKAMFEESQNRNFELRIIEDFPRQLAYPNFVLVRKSDSSMKLFISFQSDGVEGNFSFTTVSKQFTEGMNEYANRMIGSTTRVTKELISKW